MPRFGFSLQEVPVYLIGDSKREPRSLRKSTMLSLNSQHSFLHCYQLRKQKVAKKHVRGFYLEDYFACYISWNDILYAQTPTKVHIFEHFTDILAPRPLSGKYHEPIFKIKFKPNLKSHLM